ncbi:extensin [Iris pallida]|uniref:Extensin n=1 Tax=Iris pallida TaxID=29817 RepID=A0AAX6G802_IRIPA|nr:extensin [Iris pallida]
MAFPPSSTPPQRRISAVSTWPPWKTCHHLPTVTSTITKVQLSYSASTSWRPRQTQQPSSIVFCVCVRPRVRPRVSAPHFFSSYYITDYKLLVVWRPRQTQNHHQSCFVSVSGLGSDPECPCLISIPVITSQTTNCASCPTGRTRPRLLFVSDT